MATKQFYALFIALSFLSVKLTYSQNAPGGVSTNLSLWLKADAGVAEAEGVAITIWTDQSSNNFNATNGASDGQTAPTVRKSTQLINFNPTVDFNGVTDGLDLGGNYIFSTNNGLSLFAASQSEKTGIVNFLVDFGHVVNHGYGLAYSQDIIQGYTPTDHAGVSTTPLPHTIGSAPAVQSFVVDFTTNQELILNGASVSTNNITLTQLTAAEISESPIHSINAGPVTIGRQSKHLSGNLRLFGGLLPEVIVYNEDVDDISGTARNRIESYLALKYGVTLEQTVSQDYLASDGVIKMWDSSTPDAGIYNNDIFGVGRDDASALGQLKSKSVNSDAIITLLAEGESSDDSNTPANYTFTDLADLEFLTIGNNDGAAGWTATGAPSNTQILNRQWSAQETGETGSLQLDFDVDDADFDLPATLFGDYLLIIDANNNGDLSDETPVVLLDQGGGIWRATGINLTDGQEFTLATAVGASGPGGVTDKVALWVKADADVYVDLGTTPATDGQGVQQWNDQSGNGKHIVQTNNNYKPVFRNSGANMINFNPTVDFANDDHLKVSPTIVILPNSELTVAFGAREDTRPSARRLFNIAGTYTPYFAHSDNNIYWDVGGTGGANRIITAVPFGIGETSIGMLTNSVSNTAQEIYSNGKLLKADNTGHAVGGTNTFILGALNTSGTSGYDGKIPEFVAYERYLSAIEKQRVNSYFALKYGTTLDQTVAQDYLASDGTTKMWDSGTADAAAHNRDIFGIGRDDASELGQLKSKSINTDAIITLLAEGESSDDSNTPANYAFTDLQDLEFLTVGNNNGNHEFVYATGALGSAWKLLNRRWSVQEAGETGSLQLDFDVADATYNVSPSPDGDYYFVYDADNDGDLTDETPQLMADLGGDIWRIAGVNLNDGMEFTLAVSTPTPYGPGGVTDKVALWVKADADVYVDLGTTTATDGQGVQQWNDQSGNGKHIVQTNNNYKPVFRNSGANMINFNPTVDFANDDHLKVSPSIVIFPNAELTVAFGAREDSRSSRRVFNIASTYTPHYAHSNNNIYWDVGGTGGANRIITAVPFGIGETSIGMLTNSVSNTAQEIYSNGKLLKADNTGHAVGGTNTFILGALNTSGTSGYDGKIPEFVAYERYLSAIEKQRVNSYFALKYGTTLDQTVAQDYLASDGTTKMWDSGTADAAAHNRDIFGIGRDDASELGQLKSKSINTDAIITLLAEGESSDDSNTPANYTFTDLQDLEFLTIGNNNGNHEFVYATGALGSAWKLLNRRWSVQEAGETGSLQLDFDVADATYNVSPSPDGDYYFVYDADNDGDLTDETPQLMTNPSGEIWRIAGVNLNDGMEFTLAVSTPTPYGPGGVTDKVALWVKADADVYIDLGTTTATDGQGVQQWNDQSGNGKHIVQTNNNYKPVFRNSGANMINFNPTVDFANDDHLKVSPSIVIFPNAELTVAFGAREDSRSSRRVFNIASTYTPHYAHSNNNIYWDVGGTGGANRIITAVPFGIGETSIGMLTNSVSNTAQEIYSNGKLLKADNTGHAVGGTNTFILGALNTSGTSGYDGKIPEFVAYERYLSAIEKQRVNSYFALKYGTTLDQTVAQDYLASDGTTKMWDSGTADAAAHNRDIFGIGRDDASELGQLKSKSINTDAIITLLAEGESSDDSNTPANYAFTDLQDLEFLTVGNNNGNHEFVYATGALGSAWKLLNRRWSVQEAGETGSLQLDFDVADATYNVSPSPDGDYYFVYDADNDGDLTDETPQLMADLGGDIWRIAGVNLNDGMEFTLAVSTPTPYGPGGVTDNVALWVKADADVYVDLGTTTATDGQGVQQWNDQSGNGKHIVQTNNNYKPVFRNSGANMINFNPTVDFANDDHLKVSPSIVIFPNAELTVAFGAREDSRSSRRVFNIAGTYTPYFAHSDNNIYWDVGGTGGANRIITAAPFGIGETSIGMLTNSVSNTAQEIYSNGKLLKADNTGHAVGGTNTFILGALNTSGTSGYDGKIPEFVAYERYLSAIEKQRVNSYFALKYGTTLDQTVAQDYLASDGTTKMWDSGTADAAAHNRDIFGIGRDDASELGQLKSKSINTDAIITLLAEGESSDDSNTPANYTFTDLQDLEFLTIGNNNGNHEFVYATGALGSAWKLLNRRWSVQEAGETGSLQLDFDVADATYNVSPSPDGDYYFVYDADNDGDLTDETPQLMTNPSGEIWRIAGVNLNDGMEFTLAVSTPTPYGPGGVTDKVALWVKADADVYIDLGTTTATDGQGVQQWNDQSGNGKHIVQTNNNYKPVFRNSGANMINFNPTVDFANDDHLKVSPSIVIFPNAELTVAFGAREDSRSSRRVFNIASTYTPHYAHSNNNIYWDVGGTGGANRIITAVPFGIGETSIGMLTNSVSNTAQEIYSNGKLLKADNTGHAVGGTNTFILGALNTSGTSGYDGKIPEFVAYERYLSAIEKQRVNSYFALKYGTTLDQTVAQDYLASDGTTKMWDSGTADAAAHNRDIFGIGRDDASELGQLKSKSINTDAIITLLAEGESSDDSNTPANYAFTDLQDLEFLTVGNNNGNHEFVYATGALGSAWKLLNRRWSVQEAGETGSLQLDFDVADATYNVSPSPDGDYYFVYDADNDGDLTDETPQLMADLGGDIWRIAGVNLNDGMEFTLGVNIQPPGPVFAPGGVTDKVALWVKADADVYVDLGTTAATDGQGVQQWNDQSGNGKHIVQTNNNYKPVFRNSGANMINFNPTVDFANDDHLKVSPTIVILPNSELTVAFGAREDTRPSAGRLFNIAGTYTPYFAHSDNNIYWDVGGTGGANRIITAAPFGIGETSIGMLTNSVSNTAQEIYSNGKLLKADNTGHAVGGTNTFILGALNTSGTSGYDGKIPEFVAYERYLSAIEKQRVNSYFALKYGTTLDQTVAQDYLASDGTTKMWDSGTADAAAHNRDIFGIGRDDASELGQLKSKSINTDAIITLLAEGESSDDSNTPANYTFTDLQDLEFLTIGNNNGNHEFVYATGALGSAWKLLNRRWSVQEAGETGSLQLDFDVADATYNVSPSPDGDYYFVYDANNNGDLTDETPQLMADLGGDIWRIAGVNLNDGMEFTLAVSTPTPYGPGGVTDNVALWVKADADVYIDLGSTAATDGQGVQQWNDQSGNGKHIVQTNNNYKPVFRNSGANMINFNPTVDFANDDHLKVSPTIVILPNSELTVAFGAREDTRPSAGRLFNIAGTYTPYFAHSDNNIYWDVGGTGGANRIITAAPFGIGETSIGMLTNSVSNTAQEIYSNGKLLKADNTGHAVGGTNTFILGALNTSGTSGYDGKIPEFVAYERYLSAIEKQRVNSYFALKYGTTLDQTVAQDYLASDGTTKMWDSGTADAAAHNRDIFGIGRDDASELGQLKSKSINTDAIITLLAEGESSDDSNTPANYAFTDLQDLEFLTVGNNNGNHEFVYATGALGSAWKLLNRRWSVQEAGETGSLQLDFDVADATYNVSPSPDGDYYFVYDADNDGDLTDETPQLMADLGGDIWRIAGVNLNDGMEFTLAVSTPTPYGPGGVTDKVALWVKADADVYVDLGTTTATDGQGVQQWNDQSGNGKHIVQTNNNYKPVFRNSGANMINFNPTVDFANDDHLKVSPTIVILPNSELTVAFGAREDTRPSAGRLFNIAGTYTPYFAHSDNNIYWDVGGTGGANRIITAAPFGIGETSIGMLTNSVSNTAQEIYSNGKLLKADNTGHAVGGTNTFILGALNTSGTSGYDGKIPEFVAYERYLSAIEKQRVNSYFALKYGTTLDQTVAQDYLASDGTTKMWDSGTADAAAHNRDIFGIGRDDASELGQLKSKSINTDAIITLLAEGESSDDSNTPANYAFTDLQDLEFLTVGNNNGNHEFVYATGALGSAWKLLNRRWSVQEAGETGSLQLDFDVADATYNVSPSPDGDYYFVYDADNDGDLTDETPQLMADLGGDIWRIAGVNLNDGMEFTLAVSTPTPYGPGGVTDKVALWVKADADVYVDLGTTTATDGQGVQQWNDQSGNGKHIVQTNNNYKPVFRNSGANMINFNPTVDFANDDHLKVSPSIVIFPNAELTVAFGAREDTRPSARRLFNIASTYTPHYAHSNNNIYWDVGGTGGANRIITAVPFGIGETSIGMLTNSVSNTAQEIYSNGKLLKADNTGHAVGGTNTFILGALNTSGTSGYDGKIPEFVAYERYLTAIEKQRVNSYFALKYGTTLDNSGAGTEGDYVATDGTLLWDASVNPGYHTDVIGIGRDDNEEFAQKQSHTRHDTTRLYIGSLAANNAVNGGGFVSDVSYVVVGNDKGKLCTTPAANLEKPGSIYARIEREWKVSNTNYAQNFNIDITLNNCANIGSINTADLRLLVDGDGDFTDATVYAAGGGLNFIYSSGIITVTGISTTQIASNSTQYITIGSVDVGTPLPIELLNFSAKETAQRAVEVEWVTSSEINNDYFTVERSKDGIIWEELVDIDGAGNSSAELRYEWLDNQPYQGISYYRLKQTDYDGMHQYSALELVKIIELEVLSIYPNPAMDFVNILLLSEELVVGKLMIYDPLGRAVIVEELTLSAGINRIEMDIAHLNRGIYSIHVVMGNGRHSTFGMLVIGRSE